MPPLRLNPVDTTAAVLGYSVRNNPSSLESRAREKGRRWIRNVAWGIGICSSVVISVIEKQFCINPLLGLNGVSQVKMVMGWEA